MTSTPASDVCRVALQTENGRFDLVLPANVAAAELVPLIADAVGSSSIWRHVPSDWELSRPDGHLLSSRGSLRDNSVHDGDLLLLRNVRTADAPPPTDDVIAAISTSLDAPQWTATAKRVTASLMSLCSSGLAAYALIRSDAEAATIIAGGFSTLAFASILVKGRMSDESVIGVTLGIAAIIFAAVAGYQAVRGGAVTPKLMLAAASGATASVLAARCTAGGTTVFAAIASGGFVSAAAACASLFVPTGMSAAGAVLAASAVGTVIVAARLAIWLSRLPVPPLPESGDIAISVRRAHAITTGLLCGASATAVIGAALSTFGSQPRGAILAAVIGLVLVARAGTHVDLIQASVLIAGGATCFGLVFVHAVHLHVQHAHWVSLGAAGIAAALIALAGPARPPSPLRRRGIEFVEYAALAAVAPLACWTFGVFGAARGLA
jgi:type VII secretion integral membrane protein EccD